MSTIHTLVNRLRDERGAMRPIQYVLILAGLALVYCAFIYFPSITHQMSVSQIADEEASKMNISFADEAIRKDTVEKGKVAGIIISPADITLERKTNPIENIITIRYQEQVEHIWGSTQTLHKKVVAKARVGEKAGKL